MTKPLELTVYPLDERFPVGYVLPRDSFISHRAATTFAKAKRLTEAELAAEMFRAWSLECAAMAAPAAFKPGAQQRSAIQAVTLQRFASLPHYDGAIA